MLDLFSGIGGFSLAAEWVWGDELEIVAFCEIDKFCQDKVLRAVWPDVPIIEDIRSLNEKTLADTQHLRKLQPKGGEQNKWGRIGNSSQRIDLITGGFPCQAFSVAGKRKGNEDDRYLWPEMLRVIKEFKPTWIIGENVAGIQSVFLYDSFSEMESKEYLTQEAAKAGFEGISEREGTNTLWLVLDDLKKLGYEVQPFVIPACAVNAPHRRDRVWIVAYHANSGTQGMCKRENTTAKNVADTERPGLEGQITTGQLRKYDRLSAECGANWTVEPRLGGSPDGIPNLNDGWPAACGEIQHEWEPPRICKSKKGDKRKERLQALGNAIVPQVAYMIMQAIKAQEQLL